MIFRNDGQGHKAQRRRLRRLMAIYTRQFVELKTMSNRVREVHQRGIQYTSIITRPCDMDMEIFSLNRGYFHQGHTF